MDLVVKLLAGRPVNGRFWVFWGFWGSLTDVEYRIVVTDTVTGAVRRYSNPAGSSAGGGGTSAFR